MGPIERLELNKNNLTKSEIEIMEYIKKKSYGYSTIFYYTNS